MSKSKLTKEQKEYLKSIESKKKRKKQKENFKLRNSLDNLFFKSNELFVLCDETNPNKAKIKVDETLFTGDKLREITEPKTFNSDLKTTCFSLEDLKNTFFMSRYMKSLGGG